MVTRLSLVVLLVACGSVSTTKKDAAGGDGPGSADAACAATEDCFNGLDDDCNGHIDCDDAACTGGATPRAQCVADPGGAIAGSLETGACSADYPTTTRLFSGLNAGSCAAGTCGCTAAPIGGARCDANLTQHGGTFLTCITLGTSIFTKSNSDACFATGTLGTAFYSLSVTVSAACNAPTGGASSKVAPTWQTTSNFCSGASGGGCPTGQVCMPAAPKHCLVQTGEQAACTNPNYMVQDTTSYFTGFDDAGRTCACSCAVPNSVCGTSVAFSMAAGCGTITNQNTGCHQGFSNFTFAQIGNPLNPTCAAGGTSNGMTSTAGFERTVCCTN